MKIPLFSRLTAKSRGRKVVRASARAMRGGEDDYYEAEPNMKLSHAFMVVLILHVVAVGGIYAFNQIKVNRNPDLISNIGGKLAKVAGNSLPAAPAATAAQAPAQPPVEVKRLPGDADEPLPMIGSDPAPEFRTTPAAPPAPVAAVAAKVPVQAPVAPAVTQNPPAKAPAKTADVPAAATYTVAKGDNPYKIAKKLGVSYQDLLKVNNITDPTKLQIGQTLKVPGKKG